MYFLQINVIIVIESFAFFTNKGSDDMRQIPNNEKISALNNAIASVEMEGFVFSDGEKELCLKALDGKITKEDFIKKLLERCRV